MDPQAANPSGQSPDDTSANDNNPEVQTVAPTPVPTVDTSVSDTLPPTLSPGPIAQAPSVSIPEITAPIDQMNTASSVNSETPYSPTTPAVESTSAAPGVFVGGASQPMTFPSMPNTSPAVGGHGLQKRWVLPAALVIVLLMIAAGGYVFAIYLPNTSGSIYQDSLKETADGINSLINYSNSVSTKNFKSYAVSGSINSSGSVNFNATLNGSGDGNGNTKFALNADIMGEKLNANVDTIHVSGSSTPDVYLQATGVKPVFDSLGLSSLDSLDGQWIDIDHTLINSALSSVNRDAASATKITQQPTVAEIEDAASKVEAVNKTYLFSTNTATAVLTNEKYLGKTTLDDRAMYHYQVGYNKAHLETYLSAVGAALDDSSLNTWSKLANSGKDLSQVININSVKTAVANADSNYSFDMWVDAKTKLPHTIEFIDSSDKSSVFTISQNYTGGTEYPFALGFTGKDPSNGETENAKVDFTIDTNTNKFTAGVAFTEGSDVNLNATIAVTPSTQTVQVVPPTDAEPIANVLTQLGLSDTGAGL